MNSNKKNLAVFISGSGTNFDAVQKAILNNRINGEIKILFSSNPNALALEKAANYKIDSCIIQRKNFEDYERTSRGRETEISIPERYKMI